MSGRPPQSYEAFTALVAQPSDHVDRVARVMKLGNAIDVMASRFGQTKLRLGRAESGVPATDGQTMEQLTRMERRQYQALLRLTAALCDLVLR